MFPSNAGPLESYNSLQDHHLMGYYSNPKKLRHLRKMGLITREGEIVDDVTFRVNAAKKEQAQNTKNLLAASIVKKAAEVETQRCIELRRKLEYLSRMERVEKIKMAKQHPPGLEEDFDPYPPGTHPPSQPPAPLLYPPRPQSSMDILHQRLGITQTEVDYYHTVAKPKIVSGGLSLSPYSSTGPLVQPTPPTIPRPLSKTAPPSHGTRGKQGAVPKRRSTIRRRLVISSDTNKLQDQPTITLHYMGPSLRLEGVPEHTALSDVVILQQHCGGNTVCVFKGRVKAQGEISFTSRRHRDCPFGVSIYVDGMIDTRVSVCCEYRHKAGKHLGSKSGHFKLVRVSGGKPCIQCQLSEGERGVVKLGQQKKAVVAPEKQRESEEDKSSVALVILKDLQASQVEGAPSSARKATQQGISDELRGGQVGVADESVQRSAEGQENGRLEESGQKPTVTSIEQEYEEEFGSEDASLENGDKGSGKDSDAEVDSSSDNDSDKGSDKDDSDDDNASAVDRSGPSPSYSDEHKPMDRKDTRSSEEEDDNSEELERLESDVFEEEVQKEMKGVHESGKEEDFGELVEGRDEYGKEKKKESEGEGETDERIKEKAENKSNDGNHVAGHGDGADLVKNDGDEYETEDAVKVVLSKDEGTNERVNGGQLASRDKEEDQVCEQVNLSAKGEECDAVDYPQPSSQEDVADVGMVKGELEGRAAIGLDPCNATEQRETNEEGMGGSRSGTNYQGGKTVEEEQGDGINSEHPGSVHGAQQPVSQVHLAHSSSISSVSSLSSSEYSLASD